MEDRNIDSLHLNLADANNSYITIHANGVDEENITKDLSILPYYIIADTTPSVSFSTNETKFTGYTLKEAGDLELSDLSLQIINDEQWKVYETLVTLGLKMSCMDKSVNPISLTIIQHITNNDSQPILNIIYENVVITEVGSITNTQQDGMTETTFDLTFDCSTMTFERKKETSQKK